MTEEKYILYTNRLEFNEQEMLKRSEEYLQNMSLRRTVREFSDRDVPHELIENGVKAAASAPSGANQQPWHFVIVKDPDIKKKIRQAAEIEENEFYNGKAPDEWLNAIEPLGTNETKPFLESAPYLIVVFEERFNKDEEGNTIKHYYTKESVGIACGLLISSLHLSGLATLTHTPSPMKFLNEILNRPANEKPYMILVTGYPAKNCKVPNINRKSFDTISSVL